MPTLSQDVIWTLIIELLTVSISIYLIYFNVRKYFKTDYSRPLVIFLLVVISFLLPGLFSLSGMLMSEGSLELYQYSQKLGLISSIISFYFLLLLFELFEHETLVSELQMITTAFATVIVIFLLLGDPQVIWLESEQMFDIRPDYLTSFVVTAFPVIIGTLIIFNLRKALKDVWITQRTQLLTMAISILIVSLLPLLVLTGQTLFGTSPAYFTNATSRILIGLGFFILSFSFGNPSHYSLYHRRKADKILVTNLSGIPLFHYDFKENVHHINETLFSGAVVAITMLMSESIKSSSPIAEVLMKNKYRLMMETKQTFIALILTPQGNTYLRDSLERFATAFDQKFTSLITSGEILDLNLFVKSGLSVLFENFGIPTKNVQEIIAQLTLEESFT
ncbi:MAG: hypothetical protein ACXABI_03645 [Candidatus Hodarchaeales archaeon]